MVAQTKNQNQAPPKRAREGRYSVELFVKKCHLQYMSDLASMHFVFQNAPSGSHFSDVGDWSGG